MDDQRPAELVEHYVVVPPGVVFEAVQASVPAVGLRSLAEGEGQQIWVRVPYVLSLEDNEYPIG
jgi:hypothetical protein